MTQLEDVLQDKLLHICSDYQQPGGNLDLSLNFAAYQAKSEISVFLVHIHGNSINFYTFAVKFQ